MIVKKIVFVTIIVLMTVSCGDVEKLNEAREAAATAEKKLENLETQLAASQKEAEEYQKEAEEYKKEAEEYKRKAEARRKLIE